MKRNRGRACETPRKRWPGQVHRSDTTVVCSPPYYNTTYVYTYTYIRSYMIWIYCYFFPVDFLVFEKTKNASILRDRRCRTVTTWIPSNRKRTSHNLT